MVQSTHPCNLVSADSIHSCHFCFYLFPCLHDQNHVQFHLNALAQRHRLITRPHFLLYWGWTNHKNEMHTLACLPRGVQKLQIPMSSYCVRVWNGYPPHTPIQLIPCPWTEREFSLLCTRKVAKTLLTCLNLRPIFSGPSSDIAC